MLKCLCNTNIDLQKPEEYKIHIESCDQYRKNSRFLKYFEQNYPLDTQTTKILPILLYELQYKEKQIKQCLTPSLNCQEQDDMLSGMSQRSDDMEKNKSVAGKEQRDLMKNMNESHNTQINKTQAQSQASLKRFDEDLSFITRQNLVPFRSSQSPPFELPCEKCKKKFNIYRELILLECSHTFCKECFNQVVYEAFKNKVRCICTSCGIHIRQQIWEVKMYVFFNIQTALTDEVEQYLQANVIGSQIKCNQCKEFCILKPEQVIPGMNLELETHLTMNRFECLHCGTSKCRVCEIVPFHETYPCKLPKQFCLFCEDGIDRSRHPFVCQNNLCKEYYNYLCYQPLKCKHKCWGKKGQECLPCLDPKCAAKTGQNFDSICAICNSNKLKREPCVISGCGHFFHFSCVDKRLNDEWPTPWINFDFCICPICKVWLRFPSTEFQKKLDKYWDMDGKIKELSQIQFTIEGNLQDRELQSYRRTKAVQELYSFYLCHKCKSPYYKGFKHEDPFGAKREEFLCEPCQPTLPILQECKIHKRQGIIYKCRFCCSIATYFHWGTTHFCQSCHEKQINGDFISKYPKDKLPSCEGKKNVCPLMIDHPPNGEEFCIGCILCKNT